MCTVGTVINRQTTPYVELSLLLLEVELMAKLKGKLVQVCRGAVLHYNIIIPKCNHAI